MNYLENLEMHRGKYSARSFSKEIHQLLKKGMMHKDIAASINKKYKDKGVKLTQQTVSKEIYRVKDLRKEKPKPVFKAVKSGVRSSYVLSRLWNEENLQGLVA